MLALAWEYLLGRLVASDSTNRDLPEWPPHPDRVFQALVASWGALGEPAAEREALEWLESLPPPQIHLEPPADSDLRLAPTSFVPVNDSVFGQIIKKQPISELFHGRNRQPRTFPRFTVAGECYLYWPQADPAERDRHLPALRRLCLSTPNLGHSSSAIRIWTTTESPPDGLHIYEPTSRLRQQNLRVPAKGRLKVLVSAFAGGGSDWNRPPTSGWQGYRRADKAGQQSVLEGVFSSEMLILKAIGPNARAYGVAHGPVLADALRRSIMPQADGSPRALALISGHDQDGQPLTEPHCAFVPLPFVDAEYADGHLLGMAMVLPGSISYEESEACVSALARALNEDLRITLLLGKAGSIDLQATDNSESRRNLLADTWCAYNGAHQWATVTPIVLDRFPPRRHPDHDAFAASQIALACQRIGLPEPDAISVSPVSRFIGVPPCRDFPHMQRKADKVSRWHVHATIRWELPVRGPVLLGAGRYRGMGLLRPLKEY